MTEHNYLEFQQKLIASIESFGFKLHAYSEEPRAFDNFIATFSKGRVQFQVVRDRSLYQVVDLMEGMEECGLDKAYKDRHSFQKALECWLKSRRA